MASVDFLSLLYVFVYSFIEFHLSLGDDYGTLKWDLSDSKRAVW